MKKFRLAAGVVSALLFAANSAFAYDVLLKFEGKVVPTTCQVDGLNEIGMNPVSTEALKEPGGYAGEKVFFISVSGCDGTKLKGMFSPDFSKVDHKTGALKNSVPDGSTAMIQLLDHESKPIDLMLDSISKPYFAPLSVSANAAQFVLAARYLAGDVPVTAGDVKAELTFDLVYE
ncbi:type 1 fimbrial protein [Pseudomonas protegens]|uniref:fimbrial protein n=1 Tax=Pseudomonas TaxID=286 RepID=UPI000C9AC461|nr:MULTISPECIES: fimbrial protein [Pseudomonas]MCL9654562.1 type 1 fimbrial protein [Pseudomonas protegens]PNG37539.1 hypothetical protein A1348_03815 [Pseudomonas protegens]BCT34704.1 hypothetical protein PproGo58_41990 [Pseudomonas protegens]